jgi:hypothetical protein
MEFLFIYSPTPPVAPNLFAFREKYVNINPLDSCRDLMVECINIFFIPRNFNPVLNFQFKKRDFSLIVQLSPFSSKHYVNIYHFRAIPIKKEGILSLSPHWTELDPFFLIKSVNICYTFFITKKVQTLFLEFLNKMLSQLLCHTPTFHLKISGNWLCMIKVLIWEEEGKILKVQFLPDLAFPRFHF